MKRGRSIILIPIAAMTMFITGCSIKQNKSLDNNTMVENKTTTVNELTENTQSLAENRETEETLETKEYGTAEEILLALKEKNTNLTEILVWTEENDPNGSLGRPNEYISKADFSDARVEETALSESEKLEYGLNGGSIEVFASEADCDARYTYLKEFLDPSYGVFGLNQYMYKYDKAIFRVSYDITPSEATVYKDQMDAIIGETGEIAKWEQ